MRKIKPTETLAEQAYKVIKQAIIANDFEPLEILAEEQLAAKLGISRTPIKSALTQLAYDGLVEMKPGRKARVSTVSMKDVVDYQVLRESLETLAARLAVEHIDSQQINLLKDICARQKEAIVEGDYSKFLELDNEFHFSIAGFSKNEQLKDYIVNLIYKVQRFLILSNTLQESAIGAVEEHLEVVKALETREPLKAEEQMKLHVQNVTKRILT
ncbi:GntR family transcriptional regulator [Salipaludibacillus sp. CUR1]|uniref:GntR family transcriptional regulator n=1 Tax=Salipaludibacillus sp. CUR1 TaxID=2820003 RepID=UPI001E59D3BC|nr:GntR family transcriptional regulator [Salipaludibacillus sp. CUR1]MCE7793191.1 GntR family transcriptional regulator [Salipaludibacillus sp. CUR1]